MTESYAAVFFQGPATGLSRPELHDCLAAIRSQAAAAQGRARELKQRTERIRAEAAVLRQTMASAREAIREHRSAAARREPPSPSAYAHLLAQMQSMPVIEQAKGIVMARSRCGEADAFEMLRQISQRSNVPVRELAARIVAEAAG